MNNKKILAILFLFLLNAIPLFSQQDFQYNSIEEKKSLSSLFKTVLGSEDKTKSDAVEGLIQGILTAKYESNSEKYTKLLQRIDVDHFSKRAIDTLQKILFIDSLANPYTIIGCGYLGIKEIKRFKYFLDTNAIDRLGTKSWAALITLGRTEGHPYDSIAISKVRKHETLTRYATLSRHLAYMNTEASFIELIQMLNGKEFFTDITNDVYPEFNDIYYAYYLVDHLKKVTLNLPEDLVKSRNLEVLRTWYNSGLARRNRQAYVWIE